MEGRIEYLPYDGIEVNWNQEPGAMGRIYGYRSHG